MTSPKDASPSAINKPLWLASASPRRASLLAQIGVRAARIMPANIDETPHPREKPRLYARRLAQEKAAAIVAEVPPETTILVLAADTVVAVGARILPKAETAQQAHDCLALLSGRGHRVWTALCLVKTANKGQHKSDTQRQDNAVRAIRMVQTRVQMKVLPKHEIDRYIASGEWQGKAGGYAIQGQAATFISRLVGSHSNVVGLPLFETAALLRGAGYTIPDKETQNDT